MPSKTIFMEDHILKPLTTDKDRLHQLFKKIAEENTILFLGAGASVTEDKRYLSRDIIDYYEDHIGKSFSIPNITDFLDALSETTWFDRRQFDMYVADLLGKLKVTEAHRTILSIKWRQIITTNFDLLLEKTELELKEKTKTQYELVPVRDIREFQHFCDNNQVKYIKLNGCASDKGHWPFLFSTQDFKSAKQFYKNVLTTLKSVSDKITFLSVGYSFSDDFAMQLLKSFDAYNYRDRKPFWNVDPYVNEHKLDLYKKDRIYIIKCSISDFFNEWKQWENKFYETKNKGTKLPVFTTAKNSSVTLPSKLIYNLKGVIEQLNTHYRGQGITEEGFYKGEEPNYNVIERGIDVIRKGTLKQINKAINEIFAKQYSLIPIIFLTGNFGTGKTTFNYRLIHELVSNGNDTTAFEITDIDNLRREYLKELIESIKSKNVILYCNNVEIDSVYKNIIDLRAYLSSLQISEINLFFLLSIRENILEIHKKSRIAKTTFEFNVDAKLTRTEIEDLLDRLKRNGLVNYRDNLEKTQLVNKIEKKYHSDSFITLLNLVTDGKHIHNLRDAYFELSKPCQKAFVYTALVHRHNLFLPSSVLKNLVSTDWEEFRSKVINVEGRGILIQEFEPFSKGTDPDLYFRTKHPLIAEELIKQIHPREEKRFTLYRDVIRNTVPGARNGKFVVNLLKAIKNSKEFNDSRTNTLFDEAIKIFKDEPFFLLHYSINLQYRGGRKDLESAIENIRHAETLLDYRNDRFIHRKGVLYFRLAQLLFKEEKELNLTLKYLTEAKDWLLLKLQLDPCSSFSYYDLIDLSMWELEKVELTKEDEAKRKIAIEDYFEQSLNAVNENLEMILELQKKYETIFHEGMNSKAYLISLNEMYDDPKLRPYACILLYNYYQSISNTEKSKELLSEMELYKSEDEVAKFLFKQYGRALNNPNIRLQFFRLAKQMDWYENENPLRFNYYYYVAESYNMQPYDASRYLAKINDRYQYLNPEYQRFWEEADTNNYRVFSGTVRLTRRGFKTFFCTELHREILFTRDGLEQIKVGDEIKVNLCFYLNGIRAIIIKPNSTKNSAPS